MSARRMLKMLVFGACLLLVSPWIAVCRLERRIGGESMFTGTGQWLALFPGRVGSHLRAAFYFATLDRCAWEVHVGFGSVFTHPGATMGLHASMGCYCVIGHADIGDHVMMASRISIPSGKRQHFDELGRLSSRPRFERVAIGRGSWIGEGAIIMADVGEYCVVSAGAVIVKPMPGASLVAGNPASVIKPLPELTATGPTVAT